MVALLGVRGSKENCVLVYSCLGSRDPFLFFKALSSPVSPNLVQVLKSGWSTPSTRSAASGRKEESRRFARYLREP